MTSDTQPASNSNASSFILHPSAFQELLLCLADDEFVAGFANSEWTGIAPVLEGDIAFSSIAQDEIGHARAYYELLSALAGRSADELAYDRAPHEFRNARLVERPRGDWADATARQFLYDHASYVITESLQRSSYTPLAQAAAIIIREEKYHLLHAQTWLQRLAEGGAHGRQRQREAFAALWPDALGMFEPPLHEEQLLGAGVLPESFAALQQRWLMRIEEPLRRYQLPFPFAEQGGGWEPQVAPVYGGRRGEHGAGLHALHDQWSSVRRLDPAAQW